MRLLIDATPVVMGQGGIVTYFEGLVKGWSENLFDDQLIVVGTSALPTSFENHLPKGSIVIRIGSARARSRFIVQQIVLPFFTRKYGADALFATTPVLPFLPTHRTKVAMVHDLRSFHNRSEFSIMQYYYRKFTYGWGMKHASGLVTNSRMTLRDVLDEYPNLATISEVAYLGCDHLELLEAAEDRRGNNAIAFAHHTNKKPETSIRIWANVKSQIGNKAGVLNIVGVSEPNQILLRTLATDLNVGGSVALHPPLPAEDFRKVFAESSILLMPSTFEGFGIPVLEAMRNGKPTIVSNIDGLREAGGRFALYASVDDIDCYASHVVRVFTDDKFRERIVNDAKEHSKNFQWKSTAAQTRNTIVKASQRLKTGTTLRGATNVKIGGTKGETRGSTAGHPGVELESLFRCPVCGSTLTQVGEEWICASRHKFELVQGVHVFVPEAAGTEVDEHKDHQAEYYDSIDEEFELTRPHGLPSFYGRFLGEKFRRSIDRIGNVRGLTALTVCGGSGMDAEFLARAGANVIASDISLGAAKRTLERSRRFGFPVMSIVADIERLPFDDKSIDIVYVHDGLHHLTNPEKGLAEMARVARYAVSVTEPAVAAVTQLGVKVGVAQEIEDAGNRVERLTPDRVEAVLRAHGFSSFKSQRYLMYYRHEPGAVMRFLSTPMVSDAAYWSWRAGNVLVGRFGNKMSVQAIRTP